VEKRVGIINFTYDKPDIQMDKKDLYTSVTLDPAFTLQENSSFFSSSTRSSPGKDKKRNRKSTGTMNGYNYFVKKQFKKYRNESRNAREVISSSAKKWRELPADVKDVGFKFSLFSNI
jgi:hypothetical protein